MNPWDIVAVPDGSGVYLGQLTDWTPAVNVAPVAGFAMIAFGIINLKLGNRTAGIVQIAMGVATAALGVVLVVAR